MLCLFVTAGGERLAIPVSRVVEVIPAVRLHQSSAGSTWLAGMFRYRGAVTPVLDLDRLVTGDAVPMRLSTRIVILDAPSPNGLKRLGLLAERVTDLKEFLAAGPSYAAPPPPGRPDLGPLVADPEGVVRLPDIARFAPLAYPEPYGTLS